MPGMSSCVSLARPSSVPLTLSPTDILVLFELHTGKLEDCSLQLWRERESNHHNDIIYTN